MTEGAGERPVLLVLASTYPRWAGDPEPGFVHDLCRRLTAWFDVIAVVPDAPGADAKGPLDGVYVHRFRYAPRSLQTLVNHGGIAVNLQRARWKWLLVPLFVLAQYAAARRIMRSQKVALVHAHWLLPQGLVALALRRRVAYVVTSHGGDLYGLRGTVAQALKRRVSGSSKAMTVVSSAMLSEARRLGVRAPRLEVIPMGVDLQERFVPQDTERARSELLFVGRLVKKKGLSVLIEALPRIVESIPGVRLTIAGFGPEEPALRRQAIELGVDVHIDFLGAMPQDALPKLFARASVCVAPFVRDESGNQEGLPVVVMEALGCGCPVVVGEVAGIRDLLGDGAGSVCVPPGDAGALADAVVRTLADPVGAQRRAAALRASALQLVDWQHIARSYGHLLQECAGLAASTGQSEPAPT